MPSASCSRSQSGPTPGSARASASSPGSPSWRPSWWRADASCRSPMRREVEGAAPSDGRSPLARATRDASTRSPRPCLVRACRPALRSPTWSRLAVRSSTSSIGSTDALVAEQAADLDVTRWPLGGSMGPAVDRWRDAVRPRTGPFRTLFRLREPGRAADQIPGPAGDDAAASDLPAGWTLEVLVGVRDDPSLVLPAALVWADSAPLRAAASTDPEEALLADLGRASRLYPPVAGLLDVAEPAALELDTEAAHRFLREGAPVLVDAGFGVLLPAWWRNRRRRLGLRLRVRGERRIRAARRRRAGRRRRLDRRL